MITRVFGFCRKPFVYWVPTEIERVPAARGSGWGWPNVFVYLLCLFALLMNPELRAETSRSAVS